MPRCRRRRRSRRPGAGRRSPGATSANSGPSASSGVRSLNRMPGSGKSGTSRTRAATRRPGPRRPPGQAPARRPARSPGAGPPSPPRSATGRAHRRFLADGRPTAAAALLRPLRPGARPRRRAAAGGPRRPPSGARRPPPARPRLLGAALEVVLDGVVRLGRPRLRAGVRRGRGRARRSAGRAAAPARACRGLPGRHPLGQRGVLRLALLEVAHDRGGQEDRRVRPRGEADEQHQREVLDGADAEQARRRRTAARPTGSSAISEVLIERISVWLTARLAACEYVVREPPRMPRDVLVDLVEDDDRVVQRETEDGEQADDRRRGDLEADQRVDPRGQQQVVEERDDRADRHLPLEPDRDEDADRDQEEQQAAERGVGDVAAPGRADRLDGHLLAEAGLQRVLAPSSARPAAARRS